MTTLHAERSIERDADEVLAVFDRPVREWLPVVAGPEEGTWRIETREGPTRVQLVAEFGDVWVLGDDTHHRSLAVRPDRSAPRDLVMAALTPAIEGELRLAARNGGCHLSFEGRTRRRSRVTGVVERLVVGDPLGRSGLHTLLDVVADRLAREGSGP